MLVDICIHHFTSSTAATDAMPAALSQQGVWQQQHINVCEHHTNSGHALQLNLPAEAP
jgi:hypothetical protein